MLPASNDNFVELAAGKGAILSAPSQLRGLASKPAVAQHQHDAGHTPIQAIAPIVVRLFNAQQGLSEHMKAPCYSFNSSVVGNITLSHLRGSIGHPWATGSPEPTTSNSGYIALFINTLRLAIDLVGQFHCCETAMGIL